VRSHSLDLIHKDNPFFETNNSKSELFLKFFIENQQVTSTNIGDRHKSLTLNGLHTLLKINDLCISPLHIRKNLNIFEFIRLFSFQSGAILNNI
jgi:hypothetical protein